MSNLLKSKIFLGFMVVALALVAVSAEAYTHTTTLKMGMTSSQVMELQKALNAKGFLVSSTGAGSPGMESMYFGAKTKAAVMAFQASKGLTADGVVGPMTGAQLAGGSTGSTGGSSGALCPNGMTLASNCTAAPSGSSSGGSLGSDDGDLDEFNEVSTSDSNVTEGETSEIFGFDFEVEGDVSVDRIDFYLDTTAAGSHSEDADDYFSAAVLMVDGEEVATVDVEDWDEDTHGKVDVVTGDSDEYRVRFSGLDWVLEDGDNPEVTLALETNNNIDSDDLAETWGVELTTDSVRFVDGRGFSDETGAALEESFGGDAEETAELKVKSSSEDPEATVIEVSDDDETEEQTVFVFEIQEENGVDVTINDLSAQITVLTSAGAGTDESQTVTDAFLYMGSTLLGEDSVATGGAVTFENIDLQIDADDTVELTVKLTFADADLYGAGNTVSVAINGDSTDITDAEDANGNDESDMTLSGSATSETHSLREEGIIVVWDDSSYLKTSSDTSGVNETVQFTLEFDVTAFGDDMYVDESCVIDADGAYVASALSVSLDNANNDGTNETCTDFDSSADNGTFGFLVEEGQTEHFTVTILGNGGEAGSAGTAVTFRARINNIAYKVGSDLNGDTSYNFNLDDFESAAVTVYDR